MLLKLGVKANDKKSDEVQNQIIRNFLDRKNEKKITDETLSINLHESPSATSKS